MAQAKSKTSAKKPDTATELRNALPFFKSHGESEHPWWEVTPSGNYTADLETGRVYAMAFRPLLMFNMGAAALGWIVSDMAKAGRYAAAYPSRGAGKEHHGIDAIAIGFMLSIGGSLQSAIASIAFAAVAIKDPKSNLGANFVAMVEAGGALQPINHSTLAHNPDACILEVIKPRRALTVQS